MSYGGSFQNKENIGPQRSGGQIGAERVLLMPGGEDGPQLRKCGEEVLRKNRVGDFTSQGKCSTVRKMRMLSGQDKIAYNRW